MIANVLETALTQSLPRLWTGIIEKSSPFVKGFFNEFFNLSLFDIFTPKKASFYTLTFHF